MSSRASIGDNLVYSAITLLTIVTATVISAGLIQGVHVDRVATIFLAAVLIVAVVFGLTYGLLAALAAAVAFQALTGLPVIPQKLFSEQGFLLSLFAAGLGVTGFYTDAVRRRQRAARVLLDAGRPLSAHASGPALDAFIGQTAVEDPKVGRISIGLEVQRTIVCLCVVGAGWAAVMVLGDSLGPSSSLLILLAAVLLAAGALGARYGLAAACLGILAFETLPANAGFRAIEVGFNLVAFTVLGWGVGRLADVLQQERVALETLISAGRDLSTGADEGAIRTALYDTLVRVTGGGQVSMTDETGALTHGSADAPAAPDPGAPVEDNPQGWRTRRLTSEGREVGVVHWLFPNRTPPDRNRDEMAASLIDLGASAIVRTRLSVEKSEMEFVARTEHLRTILLDAVSHHFRSPLAGILGSVTSILNMPEQHDRAARREFLLIIKEQANRLNRYVQNFLSVARLESDSVDVNMGEVNVEPLIYDVWESFGEAGGARRFLHVRADPEPIRSDPSLLAQILGNVLENAIKFSEEGSLIDVRSHKAGDQLLIEVTDQGCGVPPASETRMFDRFYRSQGAKAPGLGLGLYITRSLSRILGGSVEAHNRTDGVSGLVVSITLPIDGAAS
ncbi:MAG TPA: ATP-binding protein [Phenylobacterium sp.]|nr:ATP-binding protein [Phenylobacterium sp.]